MPRAWPPVSVFLAGFAVFGPAAGGLVFFLANNSLLWRHAGIVAGLALGLWVCLLLGREFAFVGWVLAAVLTGGQLAVGLLASVAALVELVTDWPLTRYHLIAFGLVLAGGVTAGLLLWPETRRWCGAFPPAAPEDEA